MRSSEGWSCSYSVSKSLRGLQEVRHTLMSWSLHRMFLCLVFRAVNVENLASHRYVVENGINIDKTMSESSEYRAYSCSIMPKIQGLLLSENFPLRFSSHERFISCVSFAASKYFSDNIYYIPLKRVTDQSILFQLCQVFHRKIMN